MEQLRNFEIHARMNSNKRTEEKVFDLGEYETVGELLHAVHVWAQEVLPDY